MQAEREDDHTGGGADGTTHGLRAWPASGLEEASESQDPPTSQGR